MADKGAIFLTWCNAADHPPHYPKRRPVEPPLVRTRWPLFAQRVKPLLHFGHLFAQRGKIVALGRR